MESAIIDTKNGLVHLESGETLAVTHWFDSDGYGCAPSEASALVCGPDGNGMWVSLEVFPKESAPVVN